jgi:hypothetical protein
LTRLSSPPHSIPPIASRRQSLHPEPFKADVCTAVTEAVTLYMAAARSLIETGRCRVVVCARPDELEEEAVPATPTQPDDDEDPADEATYQQLKRRIDFHDLLKARGLTLPVPSRSSAGRPGRARSPRTAHGSGRCKMRRPARGTCTPRCTTRQAGRPGVSPGASTNLATCYIGVSFYRTPDESALHTAVAQIFNERGDGVVVRGGAARVSKVDKQPHLNQHDSHRLLLDALTEYRRTHGHLPARIVLHKTSVRGLKDQAHSAVTDLLGVLRGADMAPSSPRIRASINQ